MDRLQQLQQQKKKRGSKTYHGFSGKMSSLFDLKSARKNSFDRGYGEGGFVIFCFDLSRRRS